MTKQMKFCRDCDHIRLAQRPHTTVSPLTGWTSVIDEPDYERAKCGRVPSPVDGEPFRLCIAERAGTTPDACGADGRHFKKRTER